MISSKTPGNDGLSSEFYKAFWSELRTPLLLSYKSFLSGELNITQKQAVTKLIEKKDKDKRLIKFWMPISLLNIDAKIISKVLTKRINFFKSTAYKDKIIISEGGRLISDNLKIMDLFKIGIEKAISFNVRYRESF